MREIKREFSIYPQGDDDSGVTLCPRRRLPDWLRDDRGEFTVLGRADHGIHLFSSVGSQEKEHARQWRSGRLCAGIVQAGDHGCLLSVQIRTRGAVLAYREIRLSLAASFDEGDPVHDDHQSHHCLTWSLVGHAWRVLTMRVAEMRDLAFTLREEVRRQREAMRRFSYAELEEEFSRLNRRGHVHLGPEDCDHWFEAEPLRRDGR